MFKLFIMGKQRAGKDTVADYLCQLGFEKFSLAAGIYEIAQKYFGMEKKDRRLLIDIGEKMRQIDPLVWTKYTIKQIESLPFHPNGVVISDVRMRHEYDYLVRQGFVPIAVHADIQFRAKRPGFTVKYEGHPTEPILDQYQFYYHIINEGSIWELEDQIDNMMLMLEEEMLGKI